MLLLPLHAELAELAERLSSRQQAVATAQVYMKRFYLKNELRQTNPYLVLATAFYLACKMEECPQHIRFVVGESRVIWPGRQHRCVDGRRADWQTGRLTTAEFISSDIAKLGECEFALISELNSQLIVHHPYRTLSELQTELQLSAEEMALAWAVINDHYLTDLPLLHPPHIIAVMAIVVAVVFKPRAGSSLQQTLHTLWRDGGGGPDALASSVERSSRADRIIGWLAESEIDIKAVVECTQELVSLYEVWEQYSQTSCKEAIARMVRSKKRSQP